MVGAGRHVLHPRVEIGGGDQGIEAVLERALLGGVLGGEAQEGGGGLGGQAGGTQEKKKGVEMGHSLAEIGRYRIHRLVVNVHQRSKGGGFTRKMESLMVCIL